MWALCELGGFGDGNGSDVVSSLSQIFFPLFLPLSLWSQLINIPGQRHITGGKIQLIENEIFITLLYVSIREGYLIDLLISMDW